MKTKIRLLKNEVVSNQLDYFIEEILKDELDKFIKAEERKLVERRKESKIKELGIETRIRSKLLWYYYDVRIRKATTLLELLESDTYPNLNDLLGIEDTWKVLKMIGLVDKLTEKE